MKNLKLILIAMLLFAVTPFAYADKTINVCVINRLPDQFRQEFTFHIPFSSINAPIRTHLIFKDLDPKMGERKLLTPQTIGDEYFPYPDNQYLFFYTEPYFGGSMQCRLNGGNLRNKGFYIFIDEAIPNDPRFIPKCLVEGDIDISREECERKQFL